MIEQDIKAKSAALRIVAHLGLTPPDAKDWAAASEFIEAKATPGYADTWTYLTQAANGYALGTSATGYFVREPQAMCFVGIFRRPLSGDLAVHILNPLGSKGPDLVRTLCHKIREIERCLIYVKKADQDIVAELESDGSFSWSDEFAWHNQAQREDDTFPELLLDVNRSLGLFEPGRLNQARDKFARFLNRTKDKEVLWVPLVSKRYKDARRVVNSFFGYKERDHIEISQPCDYENMLVHSNPTQNPDSLVRLLCCIDGEPSALIVMEQIGRSSAVGLYCNLALYQEHKYLSEFVIHQALKAAREHGFHYMNLGGSESEGLHRFKTKFQPVEKVQRSWLAFRRADEQAIPIAPTKPELAAAGQVVRWSFRRAGRPGTRLRR